MGPRCVECKVSGRFLQFSPDSSIMTDGEYITVSVMAMPLDEGKTSKKICEMVITREALFEALKHVKPKE